VLELQATELHLYQEQEEDHWQAGAEKVLSTLPGAHTPQGDEVNRPTPGLQASSSNG